MGRRLCHEGLPFDGSPCWVHRPEERNTVEAHTKTVYNDRRGIVPLPAVREAKESAFARVGRAGITRCRPALSARSWPRLAHKASVEKRVHPPGLRHTCAAELEAELEPLTA